MENIDLLSHATSNKLTLSFFRYQESEGSDFGEEEDSDAEAPRKLYCSKVVRSMY